MSAQVIHQELKDAVAVVASQKGVRDVFNQEDIAHHWPQPKALATDLIVETNSPAGLDIIVQQFGAVVVQDNIDIPTYLKRDGGYVVRVFGNPDFVEMIINQQGYGKVLKRLPELV